MKPNYYRKKASMHHFLSQFRWYRKYKGGEWVYFVTHLPMAAFWIEHKNLPKCCGSTPLAYENHN